MRLNKEAKRTMKFVKRYDELQNCGNADHLSDENGNFKSEFPGGDGSYSIGYMEDMCQWLFYRTDLTEQERLEKILLIEGMIQDMLNGGRYIKGGIKYHPTWSPKFNNTEK